MINPNLIAFFLFLGICLTSSPLVADERQPVNSGNTVFQVVYGKESSPIFLDRNDADVVGISAKALAKDIALVTRITPEIQTSLKRNVKTGIIIGTLGKSKVIDYLAKSGKISKKAIEGKWESFLIQVVDQPFPSMEKALVIAGSDPRGTAFGVFELSKRFGVSPWVDWADVRPAHRDELSVSIDNLVMGPPSVKFRGIFLNDEDWGLKPWASRNIDVDIKDIGPKTYARIFELMLRLKANYIWPAMHPCTKAFFHYEENPKVAAQYGIILGSSHCEPMLRNNVDEWKKNFETEYGKKPGPWRYDENESEINRYWEDRVVQSTNVDAIYTVGMRGIHDGNMPGPKTTEGKIALLNKVIEDQRTLLSKHLKMAAAKIPQIFCPYKEVLHLYQAGAKIPEDVTLVWTDDNHGYIRALSTPEEQRRSGRSGIYYHLSYWGSPQDYLWLCSTSPSLISFEMSKAYAYGADRLWVFNVGDIKPAELEIEFAMDLAWDVKAWSPKKAHAYIKHWATRTFGKEYAAEISEIKSAYYLLAASGKPEHIDNIRFTEEEVLSRLSAYEKIGKKALTLQEKIPTHLQDAYFQLILYPVLGAVKMNEKHFYAQKSRQQPDPENPFAEKSKQAYEDIKKLTDTYNKGISDGKWDGIMKMNPRGRPVFKMPALKANKKEEQEVAGIRPIKVLSLNELSFISKQLQLIPGLGIDGLSLSRSDITGPSYAADDAGLAPTASITMRIPKGSRKIKLICVPTYAIHAGRSLRTAIRVNDNPVQILDVHTESKTKVWKKNVIRGYSTVEATFNLEKDMDAQIQLMLLDPGLVISRIEVY